MRSSLSLPLKSKKAITLLTTEKIDVDKVQVIKDLSNFPPQKTKLFVYSVSKQLILAFLEAMNA
ncbi:hypothetical protein SAMN04489868_1033 [Pisciglobus halotolerans]|uniref:Uncharacterized protein n=1 Tax=Pisciglobus halotolerans TaxID=745365 RepID=A0A1I3B117_9LACT|nr:hypothetical protein SAMN04489868_1033 [Pisciglobus halotolerans]